MRLIQIDQPASSIRGLAAEATWRRSRAIFSRLVFISPGSRFYLGGKQALQALSWEREFPILLSFVAHFFTKSFGVHEWIGLIQGVLFFRPPTLPFFFLLVRQSFRRGHGGLGHIFPTHSRP